MTDEMMEKVEASGYTLREIITIASYIEKEDNGLLQGHFHKC